MGSVQENYVFVGVDLGGLVRMREDLVHQGVDVTILEEQTVSRLLIGHQKSAVVATEGAELDQLADDGPLSCVVYCLLSCI